MKNYRINPDYLSEWGSNATVNTVVSEAEVIALASEWDKPVSDLLNQLEEVDEDQVVAMELADEIRNSETWDDAALSQLCSLAGMEDAWKAADGDNFEAVACAAADALGVEI